ncbi:MAG: hypothetical protein ACKOOH_06040 [Cyanobium sp.]
MELSVQASAMDGSQRQGEVVDHPQSPLEAIHEPPPPAQLPEAIATLKKERKAIILALAIARIRRERPVPLVVFGHMHHTLRRGGGERVSFCRDRQGTMYLNTASVPRHGVDLQGRALRHLSWVRLDGAGEVLRVSHRWYGLDGALLYEQQLWPLQRP